jgi:hypothetical protein
MTLIVKPPRITMITFNPADSPENYQTVTRCEWGGLEFNYLLSTLRWLFNFLGFIP